MVHLEPQLKVKLPGREAAKPLLPARDHSWEAQRSETGYLRPRTRSDPVDQQRWPRHRWITADATLSFIELLYRVRSTVFDGVGRMGEPPNVSAPASSHNATVGLPIRVRTRPLSQGQSLDRLSR